MRERSYKLQRAVCLKEKFAFLCGTTRVGDLPTHTTLLLRVNDPFSFSTAKGLPQLYELVMQNTVTLDDATSLAVCLTSFGLVSV